LTLVPWVIRNAIAADYKAFSSSQDVGLYFGAAAVQAKVEHRNPSEVMEEWGLTTSIEDYFRAHPEQRGWPEAAIARFWHTEAKRIIFSHLLLYSVIHARGCFMVTFNPGISEVLRDLGMYPDSRNPLLIQLDKGLLPALLWLFHQYPIVTALLPLMMLQLLLYYAFAVMGLRRMPFAIAFLFCALFLYFVLVSGYPAAMSRYREPVMPLVCISAGVAIAKWKSKKPEITEEVVVR
jgi:hypothetical protein